MFFLGLLRLCFYTPTSMCSAYKNVQARIGRCDQAGISTYGRCSVVQLLVRCLVWVVKQPSNFSLQPTINPLRGLPASELKR